MDKRVVITGVGVISPLGNDLNSFWSNLIAGKSGIDTVQSMDVSEFACQIAGEVKGFDPKPYFKNAKDIRRTDRFAHLGIAASSMAITQAGLNAEESDPTRVGVMVGSGIGGLPVMENQHSIYRDRGPSRVSPFTIPMMISNIASGFVSMEHGFEGPNMAIVTACATANHNIGEAWRMIQFGDADAFVAGGTEASIAAMGISGFGNMKALSLRNDDPQKASRPFDKDRDGFVMGEGAGVVVIEELEHAKSRGAEILCELAGYGVSADAYHLTAPHPEGKGAARCMDMAIAHAGLNPTDIGYVNAHGTSTGAGDIAETVAMKRTFGDHATNGLQVSSSKSMTGHLLGAAGGVEIAACVMALKEGILPPTINLDNPDPACDLDYIPHTARETQVEAALSNSFGFGGHNASVVVKRYQG